MRQRVPPTWGSPTRPHHAPRLLVEGDDEVLAVSDFSRFRQAGFEVAWCSGPAGSPHDCALLRNDDCPLVGGADVVLHALGSDTGIAAAVRSRHPEIGLVQVGPDSDQNRPRDRHEPDRLSRSDPVEAQLRAAFHALFERHTADRQPGDGGRPGGESSG